MKSARVETHKDECTGGDVKIPRRVVHVVRFDLVEHLHHFLGCSLLLDFLQGRQTEVGREFKPPWNLKFLTLN